MYRAAIIGCGRIGTQFIDCHARAYKENPDIDLVMAVDADIDKAIAASKSWNIPIIGSNPCDVASEGIEVISICTPPETHRRVLEEVLEFGDNVRAIYCEKPITTTLEDADTMIKLCHNKNVILQVNHQRRFGRPTFLFSRGVLNTGTHAFDMLRMLFGECNFVGNTLYFKNGQQVDIVEVGVTENIFEFTIPTIDLIKRGVEHLIYCVDNQKQSVSSGEEAREDLRLCLEYMKKSKS